MDAFSSQNGLAGPLNTNIRPGDLSKYYVGDNPPTTTIRPLGEGTYEGHTPEKEMISKERWETVKQIILGNPDLCENLDLVMDHFAGYSWGDLGQRYNMSRDAARGKVTKCIAYLRSKILGKQF